MINNLSGEKMRDEEQIKQQALIDNTAQGIFNHLKAVENEREIYERRWIWELLQNALDAAPVDRKTEVEIIKNTNQLIFRHRGRPFKAEEVAHLIYHGSTKKEQDIGKFGTGFITTHLLSRKVKIKGVREDNKLFEFELNRNGTSSDEIKKLTEESWELYKKSLNKVEESLDYVAEYEYPLGHASLITVKTGIDELIRIAPYVIAFNDKFKAIKIIDGAHNTKFELISKKEKTAYTNKVVKEEGDGETPILHELWIAKDENDEVEIAIKGIKRDDETCKVESLQGASKIFLAFPLFATHDLPFPVIVNSKKFEPTEKRDGIWLGKEDTKDIKQNKKLLEKASELFIQLVSNLGSNIWVNIHTLLRLQSPFTKDWLDQDWYSGLLKKCVSEIIKLNVLKTENGNYISLEKGLIPTIDSLAKEKIEKFWGLCYCFLNYKDKIPAKELAFEWAQILNGWKSLDLDLTKKEITIEEVATEIEECTSLQGFKSKIDDGKDELGMLNDFFMLLLNMEKTHLFDNKSILPNQNGNFIKKPELFKDEGVDEKLKEISKKLGIDIRNQLLHSSISENVQILFTLKTQENVLSEAINIIKKSSLDNSQYIQANIDLFNWLLERNKFKDLNGYPVLTSNEKEFTLLNKQNKEKPLAPKEIWNETAQIYAEIFPQDFIISSLYFKDSKKDKWNELVEEDLILNNPLYKDKDKLSREELEHLLLSGELEEKKEHEMIKDVELSKIAFLETKDKGIIDTIRKSKEKTRKFLRFIFSYIVEGDKSWYNDVEVECECGSKHKIYPIEWISVLKKRQWVPAPKDKPLTSKNLALVIKNDEELLKTCRDEKPLRLLSFLNISISELMMHVAAKDGQVKIELDKAMGSLFGTFMANPSQLSKIAQLAESEPELFIKEMEKHIKNKEQIQSNQSVGFLVEILLKNVLEKEGFIVKRTWKGSDYVVEHDLIKDDKEIIFEVKKEEKIHLYIEVKTTSQESVRMTLTQAREARDKSDKYVLCVVKLESSEINEENIKSSVKFVIDIGQKVKDKVTKVENLKDEQDKIVVTGDIEVEITEGHIRFKINKHVWEEGITFNQFLKFLREPK